MIPRHYKECRRVILLYLTDEFPHHLIRIPDMPQLIDCRLIPRDRRRQLLRHLHPREPLRIHIIRKRRMITRRQDEIERILRLLLHPLPNHIEKRPVRRAPRRTLPLLRELIRAVELVEPFTQREML